MLRSYEKLFEDGAKLKNSSSSVVCLLYNRYKCVIMLWLFGDPHVILFLFFFPVYHKLVCGFGGQKLDDWIWWRCLAIDYVGNLVVVIADGGLWECVGLFIYFGKLK